MQHVTIWELDQEEVTFEVSDEALESAAGTETVAMYTLGACTGLSVCPG